jgi:SAM-dependent methyltransferase
MPERWDNAAELRKEQIESGLDLTFSKVFLPYYLNLATELRPSSLLEVGCGTGHLSSELSSHISKVVSLEPSPGMHAVASDILDDTRVQLINKRVQDLEFEQTFDLIISHMCIQTIHNINDFLESIRLLMNKKSLFVFTIPHPCFYNDYKGFFSSEEYSYIVPMKKNITFAVTKDPDRPISGVPYNHRPLSCYFDSLRVHDMLVADFHEIFPEPAVQSLYGTGWDTPRYCVFHVKRDRK